MLPVLDLKDGLVVRGVAGERRRYQPVASCIATDARPATVARALTQRFGFTQAYVADLNAIAGEEPNWEAWQVIADCGLRLIVDAGVGSLERAERIRTWEASRNVLNGIVVALESLKQAESLRELLVAVGAEQGVFSLDLKDGQCLTAIEAWRDLAPLAVATLGVEAGFRRLIVLDLAAVGMGRGPSVIALCRALRSRHHHLQIISGGGIRGWSDIEELCRAGCDRVLVASALHDGRFGEASKRRL